MEPFSLTILLDGIDYEFDVMPESEEKSAFSVRNDEGINVLFIRNGSTNSFEPQDKNALDNDILTHKIADLLEARANMDNDVD